MARTGAVFAVVGIVYAGLALASYEVFGALTIGVTFFPPAGLTFAAFVLLRFRYWPSVAAAIVAAELAVDMGKGNGFWWSLAWAAANLVEPLVGASVTRRIAPRFELVSRRSAVAFAVGGLLAGPPFGGAIGATTLAVVNDLDWWSSFGHVWIGDGLGVLVVAPLILLVATRPERRSLAESWLLAGLFGALAVAFFATEVLSFGYAAVPLLVWPAIRFGPRGIALAAAALAATLTAATAHGTGPWAASAALSAHSQLVHQQAFLIAVIGAAWLLAIEAGERKQAVRTREVATEQWQSEHAVALALQDALMPPTVARTDTTRAAGTYLPASGTLRVGGDWYEIITTCDGNVTMLVGDVVGHGLTAATTMGKLSSAARALALTESDPAELIRGIDLVAQTVPDARMATMACATLDVSRRLLRYSVAGHPPPLVRTADGSVLRLDDARGLPLATGFASSRHDAVVELPPGSLVVLYTDGLVERRDAPLDERFAELAALVRAIDPGDPAAACEEIVRGMLGDAEQEDDVALLCLALEPVRRFRGSLPPDPTRVAALRHDFVTWLSAESLDTRDGIDVLLALGEAVNNAVEHAYDGGRDGEILVDALLTCEGLLEVTVRDDGAWKPPTPQRHRGRGSTIMKATCDVEYETGPRGTTVKLSRWLGRRDEEPDDFPPAAGEPLLGGSPVAGGAGRVVQLVGAVDVMTVPAVDPEISGKLADLPAPLYVDLSAVTFLDSHGLRLLERVASDCRERGVEFAVIAPHGSVAERVLTISALDAVVSVRSAAPASLPA